MLSVSQFAKDNFVFFEFHPHICLVKSQETHKVLLQGVVGADGLYSFHNLQLLGNPFLLMSTSAPVTNVPSSNAILLLMRFKHNELYLFLLILLSTFVGYYLTKASSNPGAGDILMGFLESVILSFSFSMFKQRKVNLQSFSAYKKLRR